jgi:hypothetical protein
MSGCSVCHVLHFSSHFITCLVIHIIITPVMHPSSNYLLVVKKSVLVCLIKLSHKAWLGYTSSFD